MQLGPGTRLAHYEISALLGKGGMGEVWRAKDTKLGREVAIKVLPEEFTMDGERLARFEREARVLASLDHPHVASIFGLEEADGGRFLVMQLADGDDLSVRLEKGAIPTDEAISIASQIAEGLEAAHEKGIVHRDLKPANIKVDHDGNVRVLDFGLAKAFEIEEGDSDLTNSPTMVKAATHAGVILGTAAYMSPEQARGKKVDRRADIWSFGVVLWEMLTGQRMFLGETVSDTLAAVLTREPDLEALPPDTPQHVRWILKRCLVRDAKKRLRDIGEARAILADPSVLPEVSQPSTTSASSGVSPVWRWLAVAALATAVVLVGALIVRQRSMDETIYVSIPFPPDTRLALNGIQPGPPAVSPDGTRIAFVAQSKDGSRDIWIRDVRESQSRMIQDTRGASYPFWSWDGKDLGFFADQKMKRVPANGGSVLTLADAPSGKGGTWNREGVILYCPSFNAPIYRVLASGGEAQQLTTLDVNRGDSSHRFPQFMADGRHFTYLVRSRSDQNNVVLFRSLDSDPSTLVVKTEQNALVVGDRILYLRDRTLVAQAFDQASGTVSGSPVPLAERIKVISGAARMVVAAGPGLVALQSGEVQDTTQLAWFDRNGQRISQLGRAGNYESARLSPDGRKIVAEMADASQGTADIWMIDAETGNGERLTFDVANDIDGGWSPDGRQIAYASNSGGPYQIMVKDVSGASEPEVLLANDDPQSRPWPGDWVKGNLLVYTTEELTSGLTKIWVMTPGGSDPPRMMAESTYRDPQPTVSPDGRWLAYGTGVDTGAPAILVTDFPDAKRRWEVARGALSFWGRDGKELFFRDSDGGLASVRVRAGHDSFAWDPATVLFRPPALEVTGDGERFLVAEPLATNDVSTSTFDLIMGWENVAASAH